MDIQSAKRVGPTDLKIIQARAGLVKLEVLNRPNLTSTFQALLRKRQMFVRQLFIRDTTNLYANFLET